MFPSIPLGRIVYGLWSSPDNVFSIRYVFKGFILVLEILCKYKFLIKRDLLKQRQVNTKDTFQKFLTFWHRHDAIMKRKIIILIG